ncbi:hypothetical protein ACLIX2_15160 [Proteus cibi]|uniref:hypothetical protein n=2 Tax=Morganellaceae TaxID=1903414 RepID=UPI0003C58656|nr:hypothetical protein [Proteus faecis]EST57330.1 hypothetical protein K151_2734 [Proteus hauseri ZMd44]MCT8249108.1 hypothetical protein [Proteus faecis]MDM3868513.1 hypothetical protein [Proteus faecis]MDO5404072.1 hypothetical protein [Proteus sp. (in: enterobacteria)]
MTLKKNSLIISNGDGMDLLQKECIASVTLYDVRASEGELMVYEGCIDYVLANCSDAEILKITGCENGEELSFYQEELIRLIKMVGNPEYLPDRYKDL